MQQSYNTALSLCNDYHFDFYHTPAVKRYVMEAKSSPERVVVFDTTLRDGEQAPGFSMDVPAKLAMAHALDALGVDILEAGFPIASPADSEAVRQIAAEVRRPVIAALARTRKADIEEAARALAPAKRSRIHTFLATSDLHLKAKLRITREECLRSAVEAVTLARNFTDDVEFSAEDATRSDRDFLCRVVEAIIAAGATTVNLPDTVGYGTPEETREFFSDIIARVPNASKAVFSAHCHNDLGLAVANSLTALQGGVRQVECAINGIGERAGNASLEEFVMALRIRQDRLPYDTAVDSTKLFVTSQLLASLTDEPVQSNKAIVGRNAFAHEAGIHQDGVLKDTRTYEIMTPESVGQSASSRLVLGRHSGRHAVQSRCEALGFTLGPAEIDQVYRAVISLGEHRKAIADGDLRRIIDRVRTPGLAVTAQTAHVEPVGYGHGV
jgi:2-isopropylmalate synthase